MNKLILSWGVSKGRDTYGYTICRLQDRATGQRFRCMGGGYDMIGTVFGEWLAANYQDKVKALTVAQGVQPMDNPKYQSVQGFYGMTVYPCGKVCLDGACGIECMIKIARAIGLDVTRDYDRKGNTLGYFISEVTL